MTRISYILIGAALVVAAVGLIGVRQLSREAIPVAPETDEARTADGASATDGTPDAEKKEDSAIASLTVTSEAFYQDGRIPDLYTAGGEDVSPPLSWSGAPDGVASYALVADDPDAPQAEPFVHWVLLDIPADTTSLEAGSDGGGVEGANSFGGTGYGGPAPPPGHGPHRYRFHVYALDTKLGLPAGTTKEDAITAMAGHVLAEGELVGVYER